MLERCTPALPLLAAGCWLSGEEWALKRQEAANPSPSDVGDALGLGSCVQVLTDGDAAGFLGDEPAVLEPSCAAETGREVVLGLVVRERDCYVLDSTGSDYGTVLYGRDRCGGDELFCGRDEPVIAELSEEPVLLVVDALAADAAGEWTLRVTPLIHQDLGTDQYAGGDTTGYPSIDDFECEGDSTGAATYLRFRPYAAGRWTFDLQADFAASLSLHDGSCSFVTGTDPCRRGQPGALVRLEADLGTDDVIIRVGGHWPFGAPEPEQGAWSLQITREL